MNKIYKTKNDTNVFDLDKKLKSYSREKIHSSFNSIKSLSKTSLAILAPLAASGLIATQANAQACGAGTAVFNSTGGAYGYGQLDVDGDGTPDFDFNIYGNYVYITGIGSMSFGSTFSAAAAGYLYSYGASINGTTNYYGNASYAPIPIDRNIGTASTVWIPIRQDATGFLGFIEVALDGAGGFTINTNQTGIATAAGSVSAGVCASVPLPVELLSFDAAAQEKGVVLEWMTGSELNNEGFEVQRSSDGRTFYKIGWTDGLGTTDGNSNYNFVDENVRPNVVYYYRLKQMDFDGESELSSVVNAKIEGKQIIDIGQIFPNPISKTEFTVEIGSQISDDLNYELFDSFGQKVLSKAQAIEPGMNILTVFTADLANGTYFLKLNASEVSEYRKVIIQK